MELCTGNLSECFKSLALPVDRVDVRGVKNVAVIEDWTMLESLEEVLNGVWDLKAPEKQNRV